MDAAAEHEVGLAALDRAGDSVQLGGVERSVGIHEADDLAGRGGESGPACGAEPALRLDHHAGAVSAGDLRGAVGRPVVDDDRLHPGGHPAEHPGEGEGLVEDGQDEVHGSPRVALVGLAGWVLLVTVARVWGSSLPRAAHLRGAPLFGRWEPLVTWRVLPAVALGAIVVAYGPAVAGALRWRALLLATATATAAWAVALAFVDGWGALVDPLTTRHEYLPLARDIDAIGGFLHGYTDRLASYPIHVQGHPPGMVVLLALLDRIGLAGERWVAALVIAGGALAVVSALVIAREIGGERSARSAAPFLVALPAAIWIASTGDALFAGVGLAGVALLAMRRDVLAFAAGALLGFGAHLSYGLVLLAPLAIAVLPPARRARSLLLGLAGAAAVTGVFLAFGFAWWDGLAATRERYDVGVAQARPYWYFLLGNLAALGLATGPSVAAGLAALRGRLWMAVGPVAAAVVVADVSGLSKGEVERIWLFFVPVLALAVPRTRAWLALNVGGGIVLVALLRSGW